MKKILDLNGNEYNIEKAINNLLRAYPDEFDDRYQVWDTADYLNAMYEKYGNIDKYFFRSTPDEYKSLFRALVHTV